MNSLVLYGNKILCLSFYVCFKEAMSANARIESRVLDLNTERAREIAERHDDGTQVQRDFLIGAFDHHKIFHLSGIETCSRESLHN
jgi:hypothetical protein